MSPPPHQRCETWPRTDKERGRKRSQVQCKSSKHRAGLRAQKKAQEIAELAGLLDKDDEFSWRQRRKLGLKTFMNAFAFGYGKLVAYHVATFAAAVSLRTIQDWVYRWRSSKEGFEASFAWGGQSSPSILMEEDVMAASRTWWREHAPKKGMPL